MNAHEMSRAVSGFTADLLLSDDSPNEPLIVSMKSNFDTACWSFLPPHRIFIGDKCLAKAKKRLGKEKMTRYLESFFRHEVGHLRQTERDFKLVNAKLAEIKAPFSLFNFFEDARIEHLERERSGERFNWCLYEDMPESPEGLPNPPLAEFFLLIQMENVDRELRNPDVVAYYDRAIDAKTSLDLIPILKDWISQFGATAPAERFSEELSVSFQLQSDSSFMAEFQADTFKPGDAPPKKGEKVKVVKKKRSSLLADMGSFVDFESAERLATKFLKLFGTRIVGSRSEEPSSRISARHLELDRPCYKRKEVIKSTVKNLSLVIDCSGSMGGQPIADARSLAWALSHLASMGKIKGTIILSAVSRNTAINEKFTLPLSKDVVSRIHAFGDAEGLCAAILTNETTLSEADIVFVKTDGDICDEPVDKLQVKRKGIVVCGLYSGGVEKAEDMKLHFDRFFVRNSLESLVDALLQSRLT